MRRASLLVLAAAVAFMPRSWWQLDAPEPAVATPPRVRAATPADPVGDLHRQAEARLAFDRAALERYRPGFPFWEHVFVVPDGAIAFGSARDGRLLATFPTGGDWFLDGRWEEPALSVLLDGERLPRDLDERRAAVEALLEARVGPVIHNPTRGEALRPNAERYGAFLETWGRIYERFGVPAELGLAQALVESGFNGNVKSEARAVGFCQWLPRNWKRLQRLSDAVIEVENQTTQAAYCAAYLGVLATKYGTYIPALSEHHAGAINVGRAVINGARLGGMDVRERYLMGSEFAVDVRALSPGTFGDVVGTYGPRSFRYAEMVFGNMATVREIRERKPQAGIHAMRTPRAFTVGEVARRSGLSVREVKRFNPALARRVPQGATLYLPRQVDALGRDVAYWRRPAPASYMAVMSDFQALRAPLEAWEDPDFDRVLRTFRDRFAATDTEEGDVMVAVLGYVRMEMPSGRRILSDFRTNPRIARHFQEGVALRRAAR